MKNRLRFAAGAIVAVLVISIGSGAQQGKATANESNQIVFNVFVYDKLGAPVMGLAENDFSIFVNKQPTKIDFFSGRDAPESICLLVETSAFMRHREMWETAVSKLRRFVMLSNPGSEFLLITFSDAPKLVVDWASDKNVLASAILAVEHGEQKGTTALSDACVLAINKFPHAKNQKKFIVLIAHGGDDSSKTPHNQFRSLLENSGVSVACIAITDPTYDAYAGHGRVFLEEITSATGGIVSFPGTTKEIADSIDQGALLMRHGYQIGLNKASLPNDGKHHKLTVKVSPNDGNTRNSERYVVRAPEGFRTSN